MPTSQPPEPLQPVLARIREGDEAALTELLQRYEPRLRTAAKVLLGPLLRPQLDSLDLVQSVHRVLLPVLREGKYDLASPDQLLALAVTIVRRKVARNWRRLQREQTLRAQTCDNGTPAADDPSQIAQARDALQYLLKQLGEDEQRLVELRLEGYSTVEIAGKLNCDAHALRARLSRLRQRLRKIGYFEWV
ncbi:MAG: sigma-70 family RNA polymerase sigma factor [Planctomycetota bacterium]|nr:MAG: sigma-70 family RNA polymerase sigma factor [Planctomycetota bacterium]